MRFLLTLWLLAAPAYAVAADGAPAAVPAKSVTCSMVGGAMKIASGIRKLDIKRSVPCTLEGKDQVEKYLRDTLNKKIPPERIRNEGLVYGLLGIVPLGFDYLNSIIKLYTDQLGGYYDPDTDAYVMANWLPAGMQLPIAVHELTHALQDQHFKLDALMDEVNDDSDALLARSAMVEGDATAVMLDYARSISGEPSIAKEKSVSAFMMQNITGAMLSSGVSAAPPALQSMLIFPYVSGLRFVHQLLREGGTAAVDKAFLRPPDSCEEILHPERYLKGKPGFKKPERPALEQYSITPATKPAFEDRLGEFVISTMLSSFIPPLQASRAASGWDGDRLWYFDDGKNGPTVLYWRLLWDSENDSDEFSQALSEAFEKRFGKDFVVNEKGDSVVSGTPVGTVEIKKNGREVALVISSQAISSPSTSSLPAASH